MMQINLRHIQSKACLTQINARARRRAIILRQIKEELINVAGRSVENPARTRQL
jgi:hypothetical protein